MHVKGADVANSLQLQSLLLQAPVFSMRGQAPERRP
jgi:hypothetical protein